MDPLYALSGAEIQTRFEAALEPLMNQVRATPDEWVKAQDALEPDYLSWTSSQNGNIVLASRSFLSQYMRVISRKWLNELAKKHPDAKSGLDAWFHEAEDADWANPAQIRAHFATASILKNGRVVFNIAGNTVPFGCPN